MPNHHSQQRTEKLPQMKTVYTSKNNTNRNREDYLNQMRITPEYKREVDLTTGVITIWYMRTDDYGIKVTTSNAEGSCTIEIKHFHLDEQLGSESHEFHPLGFSASVTAHLLTPEDLEQQRAFRQQQQERKDALKKAHYSSPKTCAGVFRCEYCDSEARWHQASCGYDGT